MTGQAPQFVKFVSAVEGHLVTRWGSLGGVYFGAKVATPDEVKNGASPITWDEDRVYGLTEQFVRRFSRELSQALRDGDLKERNADDFKRSEEAREEAEKKLLEAAKKAREEAEAAQSEGGDSDSGPSVEEEGGDSDSPQGSESAPSDKAPTGKSTAKKRRSRSSNS